METPATELQGNASGNLTTLEDHEKRFFELYGYEYDYDSFVALPLEEVVPVGLIYGLIFLVGVVGNSLAIFSIGYFRRMRSVTNIFLLSLAVTDLLVILLCLPIKMAAFFTFSWEFGGFLCKFVHYMQNVSLICSVGTLTVISIERFIAVKFALKAKSICTRRHALIVILIIWFLAFILAVPIVFGRLHYERGVVRKAFICVKQWSEPRWSILYEMYMLIIIFVIPFIIMLICYLVISIQVWHVSNWRSVTVRNSATSMRTTSAAEKRRETPSSEEVGQPICSSPSRQSKSSRQGRVYVDDTKKQVVVMLMVIVFIFALCWLPILMTEVLVALGKIDYLDFHIRNMRICFFLLSYANSCVNPIVYAFMSRNFRETFKEALWGCVKGCRLRRLSRCVDSKPDKRAEPVKPVFKQGLLAVKNGTVNTDTSQATEEVELVGM